MPAIQAITDDLLIEAVKSARSRVLMISPGVCAPLARAVAEAWHRLGRDRVTAILDVDPEICRIGYGDLEGLVILQEAASDLGEAVGQETGVRICVFMVDDQTFVFSPTPRQLEEAPGNTLSGAESAEAGQGTPFEDKTLEGQTVVTPTKAKTNGIVLSTPPAHLEAELGGGPDGIAGRKVGLDPLNESKLKATTEDLKRNPPKNFDLSRAVNVYNAKIRFVELKVAGCQLSEHTARLPAHLLKVIKNNAVLSKKIQNSIKLIDPEDPLITGGKLSQATILQWRDKIEEEYFRLVKGVGWVMQRSAIEAFEKELKGLTSEVKSFAGKIEGNLADLFKKTAEELASEILEDVQADLPPIWRKKYGPKPDQEWVRTLIIQDLLKAFGSPAGKVGKMKVSHIYKDVTYEMLNDTEFRRQISKYFPELPVMEEFIAAKERDDSSPRNGNS